MKVLMVCTVPTAKSGIPNVVFNLMGAIREYARNSDIELGYVSINQPEAFYSDKLYEWGVESHVLERKITSPLKYIRRLAKIAKGYDIIHVHGNSATMVLEMIAGKLAGVPVRIAHSHNTTCKMKIIDKLARPIFYQLCNERIACGNKAGEWLFRNRKFRVLNNGIESRKFKFDQVIREKVRNEIGVTDGVVVGHIGNFVEPKNHTFLIKVFAEFNKKHPSSKLMLLGDGPLRDDIQEFVELLDLSDRIVFMGSVSNPERYMHAMDIVVMPSLYEGLPLTLVEEQSNGLSILASDSISRESNIAGLVHFFSLLESTENWVRKIESLLKFVKHNEKTSNDAIRKIKAANYDIERVEENLLEYYGFTLR